MPLPYAPPPKDSKVYRDLKNLKINSVTADQMDTLKGELFAQGVDGSEDEMRRLQLLGEVSNTQSSSGPIPATTSIDLGDAAITASGGTTTWAYKPKGEVHQIMGFSYVASNMGGASMSMQLYLDDGTNTVLLGEKSTTDAADNFGDIDWTSVYLDENVQLKLTIYATFPGSGSVQPKLATVRVR